MKKSDYDAKVSELENKIPSITGFVTTSALTAVEKNFSSVSNLVKKTDYDTKYSELEKKITDHKHNKYITTSEFDKLTVENFAARLAQANLITKTHFDAKLSSLNGKTTSIKQSTYLLKMKKLKTSDLGYFIGKNHFNEDDAQHCLVLQPILWCFTLNRNWIIKWKLFLKLRIF